MKQTSAIGEKFPAIFKIICHDYTVHLSDRYRAQPERTGQ